VSNFSDLLRAGRTALGDARARHLGWRPSVDLALGAAVSEAERQAEQVMADEAAAAGAAEIETSCRRLGWWWPPSGGGR